jgi:proton glutamate symport protein
MSKTTIILIALIGGVALGIFVGEGALTATADVIGALWLNGLRMTVIPLVVALLITGIAQTAAAARAGKLATRAVITMIVILWISTIIAAGVIQLLLYIFPIPGDAAIALKAALTGIAKPEPVPPFSDFIRAMVPTNPINAAANDAILPLIIFTTIFAFAITRLPEEKRGYLTNFFAALADAMIVVITWVLALAPIGVFALAFVVGAKVGVEAFGALAHYVIIVSTLGVIVWIASFGLAVVGARKGFLEFFRASLPAQAVAVSTQSSLASLPAMLSGMKVLGVRESSSDVILPLAVAIFRGTSPVMNIGVAFYVAHWFGIELTPTTIAFAIVVAATTTLGSVSLPGTVSFMASVTPICIAIGAPIEPLGLLIAIETFPDIFRTLGNVTMDMAVTGTVARQHEEA